MGSQLMENVIYYLQPLMPNIILKQIWGMNYYGRAKSGIKRLPFFENGAGKTF